MEGDVDAFPPKMEVVVSGAQKKDVVAPVVSSGCVDNHRGEASGEKTAAAVAEAAPELKRRSSRPLILDGSVGGPKQKAITVSAVVVEAPRVPIVDPSAVTAEAPKAPTVEPTPTLVRKPSRPLVLDGTPLNQRGCVRAETQTTSAAAPRPAERTETVSTSNEEKSSFFSLPFLKKKSSRPAVVDAAPPAPPAPPARLRTAASYGRLTNQDAVFTKPRVVRAATGLEDRAAPVFNPETSVVDLSLLQVASVIAPAPAPAIGPAAASATATPAPVEREMVDEKGKSTSHPEL